MANNTDKFFQLLEYNIAKGKRPLLEADAPQVPDVEEQPLGYEKKTALGSAPKPGVPATDDAASATADAPAPAAPAAGGETAAPTVPGDDETAPDPTTEPTEGEEGAEVDAVEKGGDDKADDVEDILGKLVRLHAEKLDAIDAYMQQNDMLVQQVQAKANGLDAVQGEMSHMKDQIKILTPPTPLEAGNKMIAAAGGTRVEDYWNNWLAKNKRDEQLSGNPYYPSEGGEETYSVQLDDVPDLSKDQIKKSFFGKDGF
jgi:hypothetical protein